MATPSLAIRINQEYTSLVPKMSDSEYESFKQDIKENGLRMPITVNHDGIILDGHHRYRACRELGIQCESEPPKSFDDQLEEKDYVIGVNLERRNLTDFQRGILVLRRKPIRSEIALRNMLKGKTLESNESRVDTNKELAKSAGLSKSKLRKIEIIENVAKNEASPKYKEYRDKAARQVWSIDKTFNKIHNDLKKQKLLDTAPSIDLPDSVNLIEGDFRKIDPESIPDGSINLIFVDTLYEEKWLPNYSDLALLAARTLVQNGSLVTYCNQTQIPEIFAIMKTQNLTYWNIIAVPLQNGFARNYPRRIVYKYKPLLWFVKGKREHGTDFLSNLVSSKKPDKNLSPYEQSPVEAEHVISRLTIEGQRVLDPMMGSGTTGITSLKLNRKFTGIDIDPETFKIAEANIKKYYSSKEKKR